jgi:hypothetical protein
LKVVGQGREKISFMDCRLRALSYVIYIPSLDIKLNYMSNMVDSRIHVAFDEKSCMLARGNLVLGKRV